MTAPVPLPEGSPRSFEGDVVRVRRNPIVMGLGAAPFLGLAAMFAAVGFDKPVDLALGITGVVAVTTAAIPSLLWLHGRNWLARRTPLRAKADPEGLRLDGVHFPRRALKAQLVSSGEENKVRLGRRFAPALELDAESGADARALLFALGLDASQNLTVYHGMSRYLVNRRNAYQFRALAMGSPLFLGPVALCASAASVPVGIAIGLAAVALLVASSARTKIIVGAEGLWWSWMGVRRFIGYGDVESIERDQFGGTAGRLLVQLHSGQTLFFRPSDTKDRREGQTLLDQLEGRLTEAMASYRAGGTAGDAARLARGSRETKAWLASLRAIGSGANVDARTAPLPREQLFRIVEDSATDASARAAAAVALGMHLDAEGRARVRSAATATAAPKLRIALEAIAEGAADPELEAALAEVEVEARKARPFE